MEGRCRYVTIYFRIDSNLIYLNSIQSIVKAESLRLCGAQKVRYSTTRANGAVTRTRIILPSPTVPGTPLWNRAISHQINTEFINTVVDAVSEIPVSSNNGRLGLLY